MEVNSSDISEMTIDKTIISPASPTIMAMSSRSDFFNIWHITATTMPIAAILKMISTLILSFYIIITTIISPMEKPSLTLNFEKFEHFVFADCNSIFSLSPKELSICFWLMTSLVPSTFI